LSDSIVDLIEVEIFNIGSENPVKELTKHTVCNPKCENRNIELTTCRSSFPGSSHHIERAGE